MKTVTYDDTKWRLVPVEPTEEMCDRAAREVWAVTKKTNAPRIMDVYMDRRYMEQNHEEARIALQTGIAAAPTPPESADSDRRDAERYRWLRDGCGIVEYKAIAGSIGPGMLPSGQKLDQAIDAAMASQAVPRKAT